MVNNRLTKNLYFILISLEQVLILAYPMWLWRVSLHPWGLHEKMVIWWGLLQFINLSHHALLITFTKHPSKWQTFPSVFSGLALLLLILIQGEILRLSLLFLAGCLALYMSFSIKLGALAHIRLFLTGVTALIYWLLASVCGITHINANILFWSFMLFDHWVRFLVWVREYLLAKAETE